MLDSTQATNQTKDKQSKQPPLAQQGDHNTVQDPLNTTIRQ